MTFILTNDDGVNAPGIRALWEAMNNADLSLPFSIVCTTVKYQ